MFEIMLMTLPFMHVTQLFGILLEDCSSFAAQFLLFDIRMTQEISKGK